MLRIASVQLGTSGTIEVGVGEIEVEGVSVELGVGVSIGRLGA